MIRSPSKLDGDLMMNTHANLPRRSYDPGVKLGMVLEALKQEQSIAKVASDNMVNVNQLSRWIREYREGAAWAHKAQIGFFVLVKFNRTLFLESFHSLLATYRRYSNAVFRGCNTSCKLPHLAS